MKIISEFLLNWLALQSQVQNLNTRSSSTTITVREKLLRENLSLNSTLVFAVAIKTT